MRRALLVALLAPVAPVALGSGCWIGWRAPDPPAPASDVPTGEMRRTYYAGEQILRSELRVLVYPDGHVVRQGVNREYYRDGSLRFEHFFRQDEPTGVWKDWYEGGVLRSEIDFGDGLTLAPMRFWYPDGDLEAEGFGLDGVKEGEWVFYYPGGAISHQGAFVGAKRVGTWSFFDRQGQLREQGEYVNGLREGAWRFWDADGTPASNATRSADEE